MRLGATWTGEGTSFVLFSDHAERVELCLFDDDGAETRIEVSERDEPFWRTFRPGIGPGRRYGYRVHGPLAPERGHRFDPTKVLLDPYAKAIDEIGDSDRRGVVVDERFDWEGDHRPATPWAETVIYELHVRGFTQRHPRVREDLRGTFAGLATDEATDHLTSLGVTAVELLPIHHMVDEEFIRDRGLTNYWGYSSIGFFAPAARYAASGMRGEQVREFKGMVKALHRAGIEVILDVVYNHTAEGNHLGPTLSFKGIANTSYYRLAPDDPRYYVDFTGTGNTLNAPHPAVERLILDSLRYFAVECHVDGFRFDLAPALIRDSRFLAAIAADPVVSGLKLIAEPWDLGPDGYRLGTFPPPWAEWNAAYRSGIRDFWRGRASAVELRRRMQGSSDLFGSRGPWASINYVTAHDGFTLADLVSYNEKHNQANPEANRDGSDDNRSWNCGAEGPTDDESVNSLRQRQQRNFLTTLMLSRGVPMLLGGDELGRTQHGNNNAWCQDNELSWIDWELDENELRLLAFTQHLTRLRRTTDAQDFGWFRADGEELGSDESTDGPSAVAALTGGASGGALLLLFNPHPEPVVFRLPVDGIEQSWVVELSTADPDSEGPELPAGRRITVGDRSIVVLRRP